MYRLLVVDDEAGHRAGLIGLLCMLKPEYLVFEAENGERALQMMSVMSFDLVLSDIRMPIMDGMSFLTAVKSKYKHTRFAILSAYGTFEYAKQGLELGADDYLLKPVETEELRTCLDRMEGRVQDERLLEQEQEAMHHNLLNMQSTYFEQQIYRFVMGDLPMSEEKDVRIIFGSEGSGVLVYARPDNGRIEASVRDHLRFMFRERLKTLGAAVAFCPASDRDAMVTLIACGADKLSSVVQVAKQCGEALSKELGITLILGACAVPDTFFTRLATAFQVSHAACLKHFYQPEGTFFLADVEAPFEPFGRIHLDLRLAEVTEHLRKKNAQAAYALFEEPILALIQKTAVYPSKLKEVVMYALMLLSGMLTMEEGQQEKLFAQADASMLESRSLAEFMEGLHTFLNSLCEDAVENTPMAKDEMTDYVEAHYQEDISLASVAKVFHYNPSHFSVVFKQHVGVAFSSYLFELRMQKAAQLLLSTDHFAVQIGVLVGYPNAAYFTKAFKKRYGVAPDQYRKGRRAEKP